MTNPDRRCDSSAALIASNARVQVMGQALAGQTLSSSGLLEILQGGLSDICSCERYGTMQQVYQDFILAMGRLFGHSHERGLPSQAAARTWIVADDQGRQ